MNSFIKRSDRIFTPSTDIFTPIDGYMGYRDMEQNQAMTQEEMESRAKTLTARMNSVRYIGEQAMWMYGCAHNILKEYENATNIDVTFADKCAEIKQAAWDKAKACEKYAASLQEKLKYLTDALAGE